MLQKYLTLKTLLFLPLSAATDLGGGRGDNTVGKTARFNWLSSCWNTRQARFVVGKTLPGAWSGPGCTMSIVSQPIFFSGQPKQCKDSFHLHLTPVILANATVLTFVLPRNSRFNFHCHTQREEMPTQKSARKCQLRPFVTSCAKDYAGHWLVQTNFSELPTGCTCDKLCSVQSADLAGLRLPARQPLGKISLSYNPAKAATLMYTSRTITTWRCDLDLHTMTHQGG